MSQSVHLPRKAALASSVILATLGALSAPAQAQSESPRAALEEVMVTAQRRVESLQDTPISIQALSAEQLEVKGIVNLVDLHTHVPNFQIAPHPTSSTDIRAFMRGVGNNDDQITQDPSVAIYLDGAYMARIQGLAMEVADIERIEVLRGPQGALYGRNATGGAINFVSRPPDTGALSAKQTFGVGNRDAWRSSTRVNVPLVEDQLAVQLSWVSSEKDGFIRNLGPGADRFGNADRDAGRVDFLWEPTGSFSARYHYDRSRVQDTPAFIDAVSLDSDPEIPWSGDPAEPELRENDITADGHGLTLTWDLSASLSLKSITTYRELDSLTNRDYLTGVIIPGRPLTGGTNTTIQDQFTQELQLTGEALEGQLDYVAGLYYFEESAERQDLRGSRRDELRLVSADNEALAVFGQGTWTPDIAAQRLHLTLGGRWSRDKREASFQDGVVENGVPMPTGEPVRGDNDYNNFSPTAVVAWDLTDDANLYAKWARGYKTGGFNLRASSPAKFSEGFDEEQLDSFEIGLKSQFLDNRLRLNAALFHSEYDDIQINTQSDPVDPSITDVLNAGKADIQGLELELTALLTDQLTVNLNYGYLDPEYKEIIGADGVNRADEVSPINAPEHSGTIDLAWTLPTTRWGTLSANLGYTWQDDMITSSSNADYVIESYGLLNGRVTLADLPLGDLPGDLRVSAWGKNLTDETYYISLFNVLVPAALYGEPRSYGVDVTWEF